MSYFRCYLSFQIFGKIILQRNYKNYLKQHTYVFRFKVHSSCLVRPCVKKFNILCESIQTGIEVLILRKQDV